MELRVGNKYRLGRKIGSGSFGDIYLGKCPWLQLCGLEPWDNFGAEEEERYQDFRLWSQNLALGLRWHVSLIFVPGAIQVGMEAAG